MIGEGTKKKFLERGIYPDFMPSVYDGNTLGKELGALLNGTEKILIPRASLGNKELAEELKNSAEICKNHAKFFGYLIIVWQRFWRRKQILDQR